MCIRIATFTSRLPQIYWAYRCRLLACKFGKYANSTPIHLIHRRLSFFEVAWSSWRISSPQRKTHAEIFGCGTRRERRAKDVRNTCKYKVGWPIQASLCGDREAAQPLASTIIGMPFRTIHEVRPKNLWRIFEEYLRIFKTSLRIFKNLQEPLRIFQHL